MARGGPMPSSNGWFVSSSIRRRMGVGVDRQGGGTRRRSLQREDWIEAAFGRLARHGVEGVRVEPLAEDLGVTKGSFYWHFKDRPDLLDAVLEEWEATDTRLIDAAVEPGTPAERMSRFVELITASARNPDQAAVESAVLAWAQVDPVVAERVARVEATRCPEHGAAAARPRVPAGWGGEVGRSGLHDVRGDDEPRDLRCEVSAAAELGVSRSAARSGSASRGASTQAARRSLTVVVSSPVVWPAPTPIGTCT